MDMGMYCEVCEKNGVKDKGYQVFELGLVDTNVEDVEYTDHVTLTYEGKCPECGTIYQYICEYTEVDNMFRIKESE